jgi:hypothetical protein
MIVVSSKIQQEVPHLHDEEANWNSADVNRWQPIQIRRLSWAP